MSSTQIIPPASWSNTAISAAAEVETPVLLQGLTDAQLRATPVSTSALTDTQLRATPVQITQADITASGTISTQNLAAGGVATANSSVELTLTGGACALSVQTVGTYTGALSLQGTIDGTVWITVGGTVFFNVATGAATATITSAAQGIFQSECSGYAKVRISALAAVTGSVVVTLRCSKTASIVALDSGLPAGSAVIGSLAANQSSNVAQINAVTPLMGNGVTGTGSLRVTLASDNTPNSSPFLFSGSPGTTAATACSVSAQAAIALPSVKASAGNVYGISVVNKDAALLFVQFYNTASAPTRGTSVVWWIPVPASSTVHIPPGLNALANFATGIGVAAATTATGATAPTTAPDVVIYYK